MGCLDVLWGDENVSVGQNALERICITKSRLKSKNYRNYLFIYCIMECQH